MIIGLDVGGTHTDVVLLSKEGLVDQTKVPTDASHLFETVLKGLEKITKGIDPRGIMRVVLSTTLTTNAVIQKKMPEVAMIVSGGPGIDPEFYRTGVHYYPIAGSIDHRGREIDPIDEPEIRSIAGGLKKAGISTVGVVSKFSVRNPEHELKIHSILKDFCEVVFLGHRVSPGLNFPRRIATTFLNASVYPIHREFFKAVEKSLTEMGFEAPIRILKADGGNMNFEASVDFPVQTILSGPAASVMGAIAFADEKSETLVLDIGGTTTDMALLVNGVPLLDPIGIDIGPYRTLIRSLETLSIGVGGDSVVNVENNEIRVGPERKGSAMAYGGPAPTPTDALFILGKITDGDRGRAVQGFEDIARGLGATVEEAARMVFDYTCRRILLEAGFMVNRINSKPVYTVYEILEGYQVKPREILVLGGPAPHFAKGFQDISDFDVRVVPRWHVANAIGAALSRTTTEVVLFADTEQGIVAAPEENFSKSVTKSFSKKDAIHLAFDLLREKAIKRGANPDYLEMEVVEDLEFNMVRGFFTTGKNIRIKVQIKPGLIHGYDRLIRQISSINDSGGRYVARQT
jgi:N-methylhydantoinase A/oxoprolinase/acetone carboxylase beta subunit